MATKKRTVPIRSESVHVKCSPEELDQYRESAANDDRTVSDWIRYHINRAVKRGG